MFTLNAAARIRAARDSQIEDCVEWIEAYVNNSAQMGAQYLKADFVIGLLRPLVQAVPYRPVNKKLYHVLGSNSPVAAKTFDADRVISLTWASTEGEWESIADSVGIADYDHFGVVEVVGQVHELFNGEWLVRDVVPYLKKNSGSRLANSLAQLAEGFRGQKEVVAFSRSPIKTKIAHTFA